MATLVFDSAPLSCFARARRLECLEKLTRGERRVTTSAVLGEIRDGVVDFPLLSPVLALPWLEEVRADSLAELRLFAQYAKRLGSGIHDVGEASVCAWAEVHGAVVYTDENAATLIARGARRDSEAHPCLRRRGRESQSAVSRRG